MNARDVVVFVKIKPRSEHTLRAILQEIESSHGDNRYLRIARSPSTHICNFVITDDPEHGKRLIFACVFDGPLDAYIQELLEIGPGLDEIFSNCVGYAGRDEFRAFVLDNSVPTRGWFTGFPNETAANILRMMEARKAVEYFLDLPDVARFLEQPGVQALFDIVAQFAPGPTTLSEVTPSRLDRLLGFVHGAVVGTVMVLAQFYGTRLVDDDYKGVSSNLGQKIDPGLADADYITHLTEIKKGRLWTLYLGFAGLTLLGRYAFPPGMFGQVASIHSVRWMMVDGSKRMIFQSKFDGSWENYMGDIADKVPWGIDAIFSNTVGYPSAGMRDIDTFKRFIRDHQFAHLVDYMAYQGESVLNIIRDREIANALQNLVAVPLTKKLLEAL